ncbi:methionyl-tRNA formyltransferase [Buchnera aphidicola str. Ak (Acyrthosiphon kondoi)]|uniref:Methionyl-tRNA formyltransferase n=1 Tax=Buchnera aphidicola str. Ak (Acyrthosiphon kondoi) TaxID=1005090 RepID=G2LNJ1_9GAMM|nr:methionyl-tRNA formyltransferase [Buchnera aphidicola]AEO08829.1 methionyl-tRNA formyltransferase [Buchnera aphidicola str. Ak (Acyrthosiphon kondoi)]
MKKLKIVFAGTEYFSAKHLNALIRSSHKVISVITQPDSSSGRGQKITFSPVKILSINNHIPIFQPINLNDRVFQKKLLKLNADIMIVVSYGKIIPKKILSMFPNGCINVHPSLLPRWRGATPIQSSILYGDKNTGISIINMNDKIDSGTIIHTETCDISSKDTTQSLSLKLVKIGEKALLEVLEKIISNTIIEKKQNEKNVILSKKIHKKDALLNWNLEAEKLERLIRAFNPWPVCYFLLENKAIKVWQSTVIPIIKSNFSIGEIICSNQNGIQINTSHQILNIEKLQLPGKKIMDVKNIITSKKNLFKVGTVI